MRPKASMISHSIILTAVILASAHSLSAQDKGHLEGRVTDSEGAAIAKTKIIVRSPMAQFETVASETGAFDFELPAGVYRIETMKMPGFVPFKKSGVRIKAGRTTLQDMKLKVTLKDAICTLPITGTVEKAKPAAKNNRNQ